MERYCNHNTILRFHEVRTSAEDIINYNSKELSMCYDKAKPLIPEVTPFAEEVNKCS